MAPASVLAAPSDSRKLARLPKREGAESRVGPCRRGKTRPGNRTLVFAGRRISTLWPFMGRFLGAFPTVGPRRSGHRLKEKIIS
jgi:hypothetical protein